MNFINIALGTVLAAGAVHAGTIEMKVNGLVCGFCAQGIEKTLRKNPATTDVLVSLENRLVAIATKDGADISDADLTKALTNAGYDVKEIQRTNHSLDALRSQYRAAK
jgi:copper chaperone CopZ